MQPDCLYNKLQNSLSYSHEKHLHGHKPKLNSFRRTHINEKSMKNKRINQYIDRLFFQINIYFFFLN